MAFKGDNYMVLIASPCDMPEDRDVVAKAITDWNDLHAEAEGVTLHPKRWETSSTPEQGGRPQAIVTRQLVDNADLLVGMFWTSLGTHTGVAESGTVEEIEEVTKVGKPVMLYFSDRPVKLSAVKIEQLSKLSEFKGQARSQGLQGSYKSLEELHQKIMADLTRRVRMMKAAAASSEKQHADQGRYHDAIKAKREEMEARLEAGKFRNVKGRVKIGLTVAAIGPVTVVIKVPNDHTEQFRPLVTESFSITGGRPDLDSVYYETKSQAVSAEDPSIVIAATEVFPDGFIFAAMDEQNERTERTRRMMVENNWAQSSSLKRPAGVNLIHIETYIINAVQRYIHTLRKFKFSGDIAVAHTILGIDGRPMFTIDRASPNVATLDVIRSPIVIFPASGDYSDAQGVAKILENSFKRIWSHVGMLEDPAYSNGVFNANG